ncbi:MAG: 3-oxoacyl-ACP synthase [Planctomycetes bacterium]|nr:3-oxoacyl-ACP synthase [Planctomycetota bacterium]
MAESLVFTGVGMRTPIGNDALQSAAVVRARISRFAVWPHATIAGEPLVASALAPLAAPAEWTQFALLSAPQALHEALWQANVFDGRGLDKRARKLGLYLAAPAEARTASEGAEALDTFREHGVRDCFEVLAALEPACVELLPLGNAAGLVALDRARRALLEREIDVAVIGAIDSHLDAAWLERLAHQKRLKVGDASGGLVPGEAAAFAVLERAPSAAARGARALGHLAGTAVTNEEQPIDAEHPIRAEALSLALTTVLAEHERGARVRHVWCDLNGERWRSLEWALAETRCLGALPARAWTLWTSAESTGDLGAASALVQLGIALSWPARGFACGEHQLLASASFEGARAVAYLVPSETGPRR